MKPWTFIATALAASAALLAGCARLVPQKAGIDHYRAGRLAMERQDYRTALAELTKAIRRNPTLSSAYAAIGDVHRKQGSHVEAASAYERACRMDPYDFLPHYNLGVTYQVLCSAARTAEAATDCLVKAIRVYLRAVSLEPGDFDTNLNLSACYFQEGKHEQAEQYCKIAIALDPANPHAYSNLGIIYDAQNKPYDAIRAYKESLELDVHQPRLLLNLGSTYQRLGWHKDAIHACKLAAEEDPGFSAPWEQMGTCYFTLRKYNEALGAFGTALRLDPRSAPACRGLGVVYMAQYLSDPARTELRDRALEAWRLALELDPRQPDLPGLLEKYSPPAKPPEL